MRYKILQIVTTKLRNKYLNTYLIAADPGDRIRNY